MMTTETTYRCANHPNRETLVRCGKCDKPICTDCMYMTPVGVRCRDCANLKPIPTYDVGLGMLLRAALVGFPVATVLAVLIQITPIVNNVAFFAAPFYGWLVAEAIARACNEKRGRRLQIVAGLAIAFGLLLVPLGVAAVAAALFMSGAGGGMPMQWLALTLGNLFSLSVLLQLALALVFGLSRLR